MLIVFARHGETEYNCEGRLQGISDSPLTKKGIEQAKKLAKLAKTINVIQIFSSPATRCIETTKVIAKESNIPVTIINNLKEMCYGSWEGHKKSLLKADNLWQTRNKDKYNFVHPGEYEGLAGESYAIIYPRVANFLKKLIKGNKKDVILVISHLGVMRNTKRYFENCSEPEIIAYNPSNEEVYAVLINPKDHTSKIVTI